MAAGAGSRTRPVRALEVVMREVDTSMPKGNLRGGLVRRALKALAFGVASLLVSPLILLTWLDRDAPPQGEVILGFTTSDIDELFTRVQAAGGSVREAPRDPSVGGPMLVGFVTDPEGHLAEVVQML